MHKMAKQVKLHSEVTVDTEIVLFEKFGRIEYPLGIVSSNPRVFPSFAF